ncbi:MAG: hypothetical protein CVV64_19625 [Candidatus Wallbacteria bacterium HGW-Wallbacteria-1]|jgi:pSer/pThr/pTyr-binding forkhead associated (FHA) protein/Skp family chaperone for outer membrane proteins|uniref:FHA domain-containing protein n=1 Tax=Candidatus Wallbacteria bacterium HGW-Wallbacteria-1 TaxID=2013854 RepID=A0A2N1PIS9_9BACT|nr:MAG: hypothetical protein CVV64_19625 [Candidatus Wallbacteria bacterium HGW-Wallbacteria-1]
MTDSIESTKTPSFHGMKDRVLTLESMSDLGIAPMDLSDGEILIGRDPALNLFIDSTRLSKRHARIYPDRGGHFIEDLGSTNGTYLNGKKISNAVPLAVGDTLQFSQDPVFRFLVINRGDHHSGYSVDTERTAVLTLVENKHDTVSEYEISSGEAAFIGRSKRVQVSIQDENLAAVHCRIQDIENQWYLDPMDPSKGVSVNSRAIAGRTPLNPGDVITAGSSTMQFSIRQSEVLHPAPSKDRFFSMEKDFNQEEDGWAANALRLNQNPNARQIEEAFQQIAGECREQITKSGSPKIREWYSKRLQFLESAKTLLLKELQGSQTLLMDGIQMGGAGMGSEMGSASGGFTSGGFASGASASGAAASGAAASGAGAGAGANSSPMSGSSGKAGNSGRSGTSDTGAASDSAGSFSTSDPSYQASGNQGSEARIKRFGLWTTVFPYIFLVLAVSFLLWEIFWAPAQKKKEIAIIVEGKISQALAARSGQEDWAANLEKMANSELLEYPDLREKLLDKAYELRKEAQRRSMAAEVDKTIGKAILVAKERGGPQAAALLRELLPKVKEFPDLEKRVSEMIMTIE